MVPRQRLEERSRSRQQVARGVNHLRGVLVVIGMGRFVVSRFVESEPRLRIVNQAGTGGGAKAGPYASEVLGLQRGPNCDVGANLQDSS